ncbi:hypothetical protein L1987_82901 [Smallanthus sonchifolius]|uniref:Uncharacterized protein n=1 Tax=Smallanthus sonchifolius TaxID=185202 RepID=A0ACB8YCQ4_9ASTR|nr:hypothetical protein L1987_82901 [Smallanthus sonchifolius]
MMAPYGGGDNDSCSGGEVEAMMGMVEVSAVEVVSTVVLDSWWCKWCWSHGGVGDGDRGNDEVVSVMV